MKLSFSGLGEVVATFEGNVQIGDIVAIGNNGSVSKAGADKDFVGVCVSARNKLCGIILRGVVTVKYAGTAPSVGLCGLVTDGSNFVKVSANADKRLVLCTDTVNKTITVLL